MTLNIMCALYECDCGLFMQLSVDYSVPHVTLKTTVGLTQNPRVVVAATTGQRGVVAGAEVTYDTGKGNITAWNAGAAYNAADFQAGVLLADSGTLNNPSYGFVHHSVF